MLQVALVLLISMSIWYSVLQRQGLCGLKSTSTEGELEDEDGINYVGECTSYLYMYMNFDLRLTV